MEPPADGTGIGGAGPVTRSPGGSAAQAAPPVLAEAVRSGFVESRHRGSLVVLAPDGRVEWSLGDVTSPFFPRSANKPMQAAGMLRAGAPLSGERLALACGSHSGEAFHLELVQKMLAEAGLTAADLQTPAELPIDPLAAEEHVAAGGGPDPTAMNCSGKHAAMLATCLAAGHPLDSYLEAGHPLQQVLRATVEEAAGEAVARVGTDGCGAPLFALSLTGLARAFRHHVLAAPGTPERMVADAMRAHPEYVAGTRRYDTWLMREVPGTLSKVGAEAVQAVALEDGRAMAFKIEDGSKRAVGPVLAQALRSLGVAGPVLARIADAPLLGGGERVGEIRATF